MQAVSPALQPTSTTAESAPPAPQTPASAALLGATVATALSVLGVAVPLTALACKRVMVGLELPMPKPTIMVTDIGAWWLVIAVALSAVLIAKERFIGRRRALAVNIAAFILTALVSIAMLLAVVMPLLSLGRSLLPTL